MVLLLAGGAVAATQAPPDTPGLLGLLAALFGCAWPFDAGFGGIDVLDELDFEAAMQPPPGATP
jgi:hypothetical protein